MQKLKSMLLVPFFVLVLAGLMSCAAFQDVIIPAYIDEAAKEYAEDNAKSFLPWTTLFDAKQLARKMERKNKLNQRDLGRLMIDDASFYVYLAREQLINIQSAEELQATVFSPSGPIGMMLPALAGLGLGAFAISKPKDKKKIVDLEKSYIPIK